MSTKLTTERFVEKAKLVHGDTHYDYTQVVYTLSREKVKIFCNIHKKFFEQTPNDHLCGKGCVQCGLDKQVSERTGNIETFIKRANDVHNFKYNYSKVVYVNARTPVEIICPIHGSFFSNPDTHLRPSGCKKCGRIKTGLVLKDSVEEFIEKANKIHGYTHLYDKVEYFNGKTLVKIFCKIHSIYFEQTPAGHLVGKGCPKCRKNVKYTTDEFIKKAKLIHGEEKYDYSKVIYTTGKGNVDIFCNAHKILFSQKASSHLRGMGCIKCANVLTQQYNKDNPNGWSYSNWEINALKSSYFDGFKVYIIKCYDDNEIFYKIGKTYRKIKSRFQTKSDMPYKYEIIKIFEGKSREICELEDKFKIINKKYKYLPNIPFDGKFECFSKIDDKILSYVM